MADFTIGKIAGALTQPAKTAGSAVPSGGPGFGDLLRESLQSAVEAQKTAEGLSAKAVAGKADVTEIVTAVTNAEMALDTVVAVRDKVISAYQEIMRMPI